VRIHVGLLAVGLIALLMGGMSISSVSQEDRIVTGFLMPQSLKGLKGVGVTVSVSDQVGSEVKELEEGGLKRFDLQTQVEHKLRQSGIPVLTKEEWLRSPGISWLEVDVRELKDGVAPLYAFSVQVILRETVWLHRNPKITVVGANVWELPVGLSMVDKSRFSDVRNLVKEQVDKFCNAYLTANPK
jgi:hypothetical protein